MKVTACTNLISYLYFCQSLVLSPLTFKQFEFQMKLDQNQCLAMIFRTSGPWNLETFIRTSGLQNLWHLVFRIFKSSEAGDVHQNFRSLESLVLDQKRNIRSWDYSSEILVSESSTWFLGKRSESSEADLHQSQKQCLQKRIKMESFRLLTSDELFSVSESESVCELKQQMLGYQNSCSYNLPLFDDDKTMYFNDTILHKSHK